MSDSIKKKIEKLPDSKVKISFVVSFAELERYIKRAGEELSKEMKIDGFRSGKIPFSVIEKTLGREKLLAEGVQRAVRKIYVDTVLEEEIEVVGQPEINVKKIAWGNDFEFEAVSAVMPEIKIDDWEDGVKGVNKKYKNKKYEADDGQVQKELDYLATQRAVLITVNRSAKQGDQAQVDFEVFKDGVIIEGGTAQNHPVIIGKGGFIPGFEEQLEGMKAGDEKEFELTFPEEYHQKHLAGSKAKFKVKVNLVQERQLPAIDDKFASGIGKFKNLAQLKKNLKEGIEHEQKHKDERSQQTEIIDELVSKVKTNVPKVLIDGEMERMMQEMEGSISQMGLDKKTYLEQLRTTEDKLKEQWEKNEAPKRVKAGLVLRALAKEKKLEPEKDEIEERMNQIMQYYKTIKDVEDKIDVNRLYETVKGELSNQKVLEYLMNL